MIKQFSRLFKINGGKVQEWSIQVSVIDGIPRYTVYHGYVGGSIQETYTEILAGKNIGKKNETTSLEQCIKDAESEWNKHKDRKGYVEDIHNFTGSKIYSPMLAHSYDDYSHKVYWPVFIQNKLDGMRCIAYMDQEEVILQSRQKTRFKHLDHIRKDLAATFFSKYPDIVLDGELYNHNIDFQKICSAIKRDEPNEYTPQVEYHIYDVINESRYEDRLALLGQIAIKADIQTSKSLQLADTSVAGNINEVEKYHKIATSRGYEGIMLRNANGLYKEDKRSFDLLKFKKFMDEEFEIVAAEENKGKLVGTCSFKCLTDKGFEFWCMPEGDEQHRQKLWNDWNNGSIVPGNMLTIKFFSWTTGDKPVPRFPVGKEIR